MNPIVLKHLAFFACTGLGTIMHMLFNMKAEQDKAAGQRIEFSVKKYFSTEWISIAFNITWNVFLQIAFGVAIKHYAGEANVWIALLTVIVAGTLGWSGSSIAVFLFGRTDKMIRNIAERNASQLEVLTGETDKPLIKMSEGSVTPPTGPKPPEKQ